MFVGLPITNINDQVFAATNSATKYGKGLILLLLQNIQIKGVRVNMTTSLEVNIVSNEVRK